jgi:hypothetical protein
VSHHIQAPGFVDLSESHSIDTGSPTWASGEVSTDTTLRGFEVKSPPHWWKVVSANNVGVGDLR